MGDAAGNFDVSVRGRHPLAAPPNYARYVGRVGSLAVALGVGAAVTAGHGMGLGVAWADSPAPSANSPAGNSPQGPTPTGAGATTPTAGSASGPSFAFGSREPLSRNLFSHPAVPVRERQRSGRVTESDPGDADDVDATPSTPVTVDVPAAAVVPSVAGARRNSGYRPLGPIAAPPTNETDVVAVSSTVPESSQWHPRSLQRPGAVSVVASGSPVPAAQESGLVTLRQMASPQSQPQVQTSSPVSKLVSPGPAFSLAATVAGLLSPFSAPGPVAPVQPPTLWAVFAWVRREVKRTFFNSPPVADIPAVTATEDTPQIITAGTDPDPGDIATVTSFTQPAHGTLVNNQDGTLTYTPAPDYAGPDSFSYTESDEGSPFHLHGLLSLLTGQDHTDTAAVAITVTAVDDAPVGVADSYTLDEDTPLAVTAAGGVLENDTDVDSASLTAVAVAQPTKGSLTLNPDGSFSYAPNANVNGADSFSYKANDGTLDSAVTTVNITVNPVNDAPVGVADAYDTNEDTTLTVTGRGVLVNDTDVDGDALAAAVVKNPTKGTLNLNPNGSFSYTPNPNANGADSFTYKANDGSLDSAVTTVNITVNPVDDLPTAPDATYTIEEDGSLSGTLGAVDVDGDAVIEKITTEPLHGQVIRVGDTFTYKPAADYFGTDVFKYSASNSGPSNTVIGTVTVIVTPVDDAPVANADSATAAAEGGQVTIPVLVNDTDVDSAIDPTTVAIATPPSRGSVSVDPMTGAVTYTSTGSGATSDSFTYTVKDGGGAVSNAATVTVAVTAVNHPPVQSDPAYHVDTIDQLTGAVDGGIDVTDPDAGDKLTYALVSPVDTATGTVTVDSATGAWKFTPTGQAQLDAFNTPGDQVVNFAVIVTDNSAATTTVSVTAPVAPASAAVTSTIPVSYFPTSIAAYGNHIYVETSDGVQVIDTTNNSIVTTIQTDAGGELRGAMLVDGTRLYVSGGGDYVDVIDLTTNTLVDVNPNDPDASGYVGVRDTYGAVAVGQYVAMTNPGWSTLTVIDTSAGTYFVVPFGGDSGGASPRGIASVGANLYVAASDFNDVEVLNFASGDVIKTIPVGSSPGPLFASGNHVYVANVGDGTVTIINTVDNTVGDTFNVGASPSYMAIAGNRLYVVNNTGDNSTVTVIDTTTNAVVEQIPVGNNPTGIAVVGNHLYVPLNDSEYVGDVAVITLES
jgi:YVTN family beta-propeller protein/VCBS repeat-containing protein